jgi:hypothetical protein
MLGASGVAGFGPQGAIFVTPQISGSEGRASNENNEKIKKIEYRIKVFIIRFLPRWADFIFRSKNSL